jgi:predicted  nucleic acid-binding Zn-ribbon protein
LLEQLKYLVELQILEDRKSRLIRSCDDTPKRVTEIEREFEDFEGEYLSKKAELDFARKIHRSLEQNIADLETKISRSKVRMSEVKTNKEYQAILKEIEDIRKEIAGKEDEALEFMERIESLGKELKGMEKELGQRRKKMEQDRSELVTEADRVKERLDYLEGIERVLREKVDKDLLKRCDFLLQKQAGVAVAAVDSGVCQVCHMNIPPQKFIELQRDEVIHQCPHCHRFLYWPGHDGYKDLAEDMGVEQE